MNHQPDRLKAFFALALIKAGVISPRNGRGRLKGLTFTRHYLASSLNRIRINQNQMLSLITYQFPALNRLDAITTESASV